NVQVGTTNSQTLLLKNEGATSLTISSTTRSNPEFQWKGISTPLVLRAGAAMSVTVSYTPTATGYTLAYVSLISNAKNSTLTLPVSGVGIPSGSTLTINPTGVGFGPVSVGTTGSQTLQLRNAGTGSLTISGTTISGTGFQLQGITTPLILPAGATRNVTLSYSPKTAGYVLDYVSFTSNAQNKVVTLPVSGVGVVTVASKLTITPTGVGFGNVPIGTSNSQTLQLRNVGAASVTISGATVSGTGFQLQGLTTPLVLAAGTTKNVTLSYSPKTTGYVLDYVAFISNAQDKTLTLPVSGVGTSATRSVRVVPTSLSFGRVTVGNSQTSPVEITNTGNSNILLSGITISGSGITINSGVAGATIAPGQTATLVVTFAPKSTTSMTGSVNLENNATASPIAVALSGTGVALSSTHSVALSWNPSGSVDVVGYYVYRATGSGSSGRLNSSPQSNLSYTDLSVVAGSTYTYSVTAINSAGIESARCTDASITVP
ncbi:MAG TPA: choice-of-anchor D domain-containing protein, partial [Candidatus Acidoferrum sp.]